MSLEQERRAEALAVRRMHGGRTARHFAERIGALASARDGAGVRRWLEIAGRIDQLTPAAESLRH